MNRIKILIKNNHFLLTLYNSIFARTIHNVNSKKYQKRALLSYSVYPFVRRKSKISHPNFIEVYIINKILDELGYQVDIFNNIYEGQINYSKYDLIIGEGLPISNYFLKKNNKSIKTIYYATGSHPIFNNDQSFKALIDFYNKYGLWLLKSSRVVDTRWYPGASLADHFIIIGNQVTKESFLRYISRNSISTINPPFYKRVENLEFSRKNPKKYLWFGSFGLIHKGLDIVIETFIKRPDIELHICGRLNDEPEFVGYFDEKVAASSNIYMHGFVNLNSELFQELMEECSFVILTSVSEGLATAVITAMGNGGLIPVVTKETGIDMDSAIEVYNNSIESLNTALDRTYEYSISSIVEQSIKNIQYIQQNFSELKYEENLRNILNSICDKGDSDIG